jgi:hypothetical protein
MYVRMSRVALTGGCISSAVLPVERILERAIFRDTELQGLPWIIVKSRPGLLYASLLISQPSISHTIKTSGGLAIFCKKRSCQQRRASFIADQFSREAEIAKEVAVANAPPL